MLLGSQAFGKTSIENILLSEDILHSINCLKKLGINITLKKDVSFMEGLNGFRYKKNIVLNAGNSGTFEINFRTFVKSPIHKINWW